MFVKYVQDTKNVDILNSLKEYMLQVKNSGVNGNTKKLFYQLIRKLDQNKELDTRKRQEYEECKYLLLSIQGNDNIGILHTIGTQNLGPILDCNEEGQPNAKDTTVQYYQRLISNSNLSVNSAQYQLPQLSVSTYRGEIERIKQQQKNKLQKELAAQQTKLNADYWGSLEASLNNNYKETDSVYRPQSGVAQHELERRADSLASQYLKQQKGAEQTARRKIQCEKGGRLMSSSQIDLSDSQIRLSSSWASPYKRKKMIAASKITKRLLQIHDCTSFNQFYHMAVTLLQVLSEKTRTIQKRLEELAGASLYFRDSIRQLQNKTRRVALLQCWVKKIQLQRQLQAQKSQRRLAAGANERGGYMQEITTAMTQYTGIQDLVKKRVLRMRLEWEKIKAQLRVMSSTQRCNSMLLALATDAKRNQTPAK